MPPRNPERTNKLSRCLKGPGMTFRTKGKSRPNFPEGLLLGE
jgi:hypothetical protein